MTDTFDSLRPMLETYLRERGIDPRKRFRCLNPEHFDHNPSMGYDSKRHKVHCFACGADYDLYDLLQMNDILRDSERRTAFRISRHHAGSLPSFHPGRERKETSRRIKIGRASCRERV